MLSHISLVTVVFLLPGLQAFNFERRPEDSLLDEWMREQMTDPVDNPKTEENHEMGYASPGHVEEHDFMTAFFNSQDHGEFLDDAEEENHGDPDVENYLADFFGHTSDNTDAKSQNVHTAFEYQSPQPQFYEEPANFPSAAESEYNEKPANNIDHKTDETFADSEDDATFQFYGRDGYLVTEDFNDFPEDDVFASIQDTGEPDCEKWKKDVSGSQTKLNNEGRILQTKINETEKELNVFKKDQEIDCNRNCETVCIPSNAGNECVEEKNGTCIVSQPKIIDCERRIPDPDCKAEEADCESKKRESADMIDKLGKDLKQLRATMQKLQDDLMEVVEAIPEVCKQMRL